MADKKKEKKTSEGLKPAEKKTVQQKSPDQDRFSFEHTHMIGKNMSFAASEAYKLLRTNIMFSFSGDEQCPVIGMTSAFRSEGKSLTSLNLAHSLAESKRKVLLIEGDMRLPTLAKRMSLPSAPGLSNLLTGLNTVSDAIHRYSDDKDEAKNIVFDVIVSGNIPPNPSELLGSQRMQALMRTLRERYDYILLDLPPVTAVSDALVASRLADGMIVVARNNYTIRGALAETMRQLQQVDARILGFVFNAAGDPNSGYYRGKYYSGHRYYKRYDKRYYKSYGGYYKTPSDQGSQK